MSTRPAPSLLLLQSILLVSLATACAAHRGPAIPTASSSASKGDTPYVVGLLPLRPTSPEAAAEAKTQQSLIEQALATLTPGTPIVVVHPDVQPPTSAEQASALAQSAKVDELFWGEVSLENGKLSVRLQGFERTVNAPHGTWPMEYTLADPAQREARELDALRVAQYLLEESLLPQMMRNRPTEVRQTLEVLVVREPKDWVDWNSDIIHRRWGMLGRLTRDGVLTEQRYRAALAEVAAQASSPPSSAALYKEAFFSAGLARGFLLQGKPQAAVELLSDVVRRVPDETDSRLLLGRAWLALGNRAEAAKVLEPLSQQNANLETSRLYTVAVADQPERVDAALARLQEKQPEDMGVRLLRHVIAPSPESTADLKAFTASHPTAAWPLPVARYLLGELDEQALWAAAKNADDHQERIQNCQAHYLLGEAALSGVLPGRSGSPDRNEARRHFEAAIATSAFHLPAYNLADARLEQLALPEGTTSSQR
ncbi:tetratricopeptide repeat protein [Cystobacter ferrugineus]|uniref:Tetratricopeptide repeat protein n=1 Tax=Cystobacter ferrugineus TaxID=83449 RepID=A0A1L9BGX8_9BACT|nr:tetratricopeptide repeat protein [Cystobacter ferrugineus]OJH41489.1 hypothetical protein BON30_11595 [Cystobacter ferrugineus]